MARQVFTDRMLAALKPAATGRRADYWDAIVPGLGVRVTDKVDPQGKAASRTFVLLACFPGSAKAVRRAIGSYPSLSLEGARQKARDWLKQVQAGIDPTKAEEEAKRARESEEHRIQNETLAREALLFGNVAEAFIDHIKAVGQRRASIVEKEIRRELIPIWGRKRATEITDEDVKTLLKEMRFGKHRTRPAPTQAFNTFDNIRALFNWALDELEYKKLGLLHSPCDRIKRSKVLGKKNIGQRVLTDDELFAYMRNARRMRYPWGPRFLSIAYTGGRISEVTKCEWSEFDLRKKLWTIPSERFKSQAAHIVPLSDDFVELLRSFPRFRGGSFVFTTTAGQSPVWDNSVQKAKLNRRILLTLKALAKQRGDDPSCVKLPSFANHDIRRSFRTRLSALRVDEKVAELAIGHDEKDPVKRIYNLHRYQDEMREAVNKLAEHLRAIGQLSSQTNVVSIRQVG